MRRAASAKPASARACGVGRKRWRLGLIAAEAGEFEEARRHADKAEDLIDEPRLALLLQARAAEVSRRYGGRRARLFRHAAERRHRSARPQGPDGGGAEARRPHCGARARGSGAESVEDGDVAVPVRVRSRRAGGRLGKRDRDARCRRQAQADRRQDRQAPPRRADDGASGEA